MKHTMPIMKFAYDKIMDGSKHIEMRLLDDENQKIRLNDVIEFVCNETGNHLFCLVRGLMIMERFDDMIELLPLKLFGYDSKEEIKLRINRLYPLAQQFEHKTLGILLMPLQSEGVEKQNSNEYVWEDDRLGEITRWQPISQYLRERQRDER